ncbi:MAG: polysaccharide deacetylase family protein [Myxococcales bacterium]|nr:polysaccharide deacetylase family protein [Myxococcales bacterium]MCB9702959.1 polysaccharide deacetylase family protein [Myxococcales bacterium]
MRRVIVSVHDVTPRHFERLREIDALLARHGLAGRYAALIVPNFWHEWPLADHPDFLEWLRGAIAGGVEPILHGYFHRDESEHRSAWARLRGRTMTAGEGEFLGLDREAARARIVAGRRLLAEHLGVEVDAFVAPAWLYGQATQEVLEELGFTLAEDHLRVWSPARGGATLARGPVLSYASRTRARVAASWLWSRASTALLDPMPVLRLAIHPHDLDVPLLGRELDRALGALLRGRAPIRYRELA